MTDESKEQRIFWHRDLPPLSAEPVDEHTAEATSLRVKGRLERSGELWDTCYEDLMKTANERLKQELSRLGGDYAHVTDEVVDSAHNDVTGEAWLHGRFAYVLYRRRP